MADHGIRFAPAYGRQAFKVGDMLRFWGGLTIEASGGGPGLVEAEHTWQPRRASRSATARRHGICSPTVTASTV